MRCKAELAHLRLNPVGFGIIAFNGVLNALCEAMEGVYFSGFGLIRHSGLKRDLAKDKDEVAVISQKERHKKSTNKPSQKSAESAGDIFLFLLILPHGKNKIYQKQY